MVSIKNKFRKEQNMLLEVYEIKIFLNELGIEYQVYGNENVKVDNYKSLNYIEKNKLTWVKNWDENTYEKLNALQNLIVICGENTEKLNMKNCYIVCEDPKMCFFEILGRFYLKENTTIGISEHTVVRTKQFGEGLYVGEFSCIGENVEIGKNVIIGTHVTISGNVKIGDNSIISDGSVLGKPGYGYYKGTDGHRKKVPHLGSILIGKYVEIGANTCIDCGTMDDTIIGDYTKIDNLCHIGHNAQIGRDVLIVAGSIICGSCIIEDGAYIAPGAVIKNQITIGKNAFVGLQTAATRDVGEGISIFGVPGQEYKRKYTI